MDCFVIPETVFTRLLSLARQEINQTRKNELIFLEKSLSCNSPRDYPVLLRDKWYFLHFYSALEEKSHTRTKLIFTAAVIWASPIHLFEKPYVYVPRNFYELFRDKQFSHFCWALHERKSHTKKTIIFTLTLGKDSCNSPRDYPVLIRDKWSFFLLFYSALDERKSHTRTKLSFTAVLRNSRD